MNSGKRRPASSSMPSLSKWLVVFLIIFLLVMVLVFSQYRNKEGTSGAGLQQLFLGEPKPVQNAFIYEQQRRMYEEFPIHPPVLKPMQNPVNLTPSINKERPPLRPIQGYGFALADQLMVRG